MQFRSLQVLALASAIIVFIVGGVFFVNKWNTPNTPAFRHDFTAQFLVEDAETREGFHLFESGTGKYTILIPEDYIVSEGSYYIKQTPSTGELVSEDVLLQKVGGSPKENQMIQGTHLVLHPGANTAIDSTLNVIRKK